MMPVPNRLSRGHMKFDVCYGKHSNIPRCCRRFFIMEWSVIWDDPLAREPYDRAQRNLESRLGRTACYVVCPTCIENKRIAKIHVCDNKPCENLRRELADKFIKRRSYETQMSFL